MNFKYFLSARPFNEQLEYKYIILPFTTRYQFGKTFYLKCFSSKFCVNSDGLRITFDQVSRLFHHLHNPMSQENCFVSQAPFIRFYLKSRAHLVIVSFVSYFFCVDFLSLLFLVLSLSFSRMTTIIVFDY